MKLGKDEKDQNEKAAMYDIISSPTKDSTKLTLRLSRVKSSDMDQQEDMLSGMENSNVSENDIPFNVQYPGQTSKTPITPQDVNRPLNAAQCLSQQEQTAFLPANQVPVLQQNTSVATKQPQTSVVQNQQQVSQQGPIYDEVELDALAEIERIERESAIERERFSKEVQDKGKKSLFQLQQGARTSYVFSCVSSIHYLKQLYQIWQLCIISFELYDFIFTFLLKQALLFQYYTYFL